MILSIDHIACSSSNLEKDIKTFISRGYKPVFKEQLVNPDNKRDLLHRFLPYHTLVLLKKAYGFDIELIDHGNVDSQDGFIKLIKEDTIEIKTNNILETSVLLKYLGFVCVNENYFKFRSIISRQEFFVELKYDIEQKHYKLDDKGYNCLAFIASNLDKTINDIAKNLSNVKVYELGYLNINGKAVNIDFIQHNNGEIIELIEFKRI